MPRSVIIGGALVVALFIGFEVYRLRLHDLEGAAVCKDFYRKAKSTADTSRIDLLTAAPTQGTEAHSASNLTCGELRRRGRIR